MIERHVYLRVYFSGLSSSRVGYRGRLGRLKPTSNFVERCNFGANYDRPTLKSEAYFEKCSDPIIVYIVCSCIAYSFHKLLMSATPVPISFNGYHIIVLCFRQSRHFCLKTSCTYSDIFVLHFILLSRELISEDAAKGTRTSVALRRI